jgi:hypothetical protein
MIVSLALAVGLTIAHPLPPLQADGIRALAVQYADGRRTVRALSTSGRVSWTPAFPRIQGATTDRDGLPLNALQFEEAIDPQGLAVTLALLYGSPQQKRVQVTTVRLAGEQPVRVDALEAFGVQPVLLSLVTLPPATLTLPAVTTPSSALEVTVDTVTDPVPAYHAVIANHSTQAVMMLAFTAYRGAVRSVTGRPRGSGHTALVPPGGTYVLKLGAAANSGRGAATSPWLPLDRIEITSVLWSDGLVEGDPAPAADEHALDAGTARQLDRILPLLRAASADPAAHSASDLRDSVTSLSIAITDDEARATAEAIPGPVRLPADKVRFTMAIGMQNVRNAVLNDAGELLKGAPSPAPAEYAAWLTRILSKYDGWRRRIGP